MATVEQVLLRKAEELQAQLAAIRTTLGLLQRQASRGGGAMVADLTVRRPDTTSEGRYNGNSKVKHKKVGKETVNAVVNVLRNAGRRVAVADIRTMLTETGVRKSDSSVTIALQEAVTAHRVKRVGRGWYEATT